MIAIYKSLESVFEKLTDSAITVRIDSDSRQALRHLAEGLALQDEIILVKLARPIHFLADRI